MNRVVGRAAAVPGFGQLVQRARNPRRQGAFWDARRDFSVSQKKIFIFFWSHLNKARSGMVPDGRSWGNTRHGKLEPRRAARLGLKKIN